MRYLVLLSLLAGGGCVESGSPPQPPVSVFCSAFLEWEPPKFRMDGSPITIEELSKYTIYVNEEEGKNEATLVLVIDINDPSLVSWEIRNLDVQLHWFYMTVTDNSRPTNFTSPYSNELRKDCS